MAKIWGVTIPVRDGSKFTGRKFEPIAGSTDEDFTGTPISTEQVVKSVFSAIDLLRWRRKEMNPKEEGQRF